LDTGGSTASGSADPLRPGDPARVGDYTVLGRLGQGGQGQVFLAEAPGGERVAVKLLLPQIAADAAVRARIAAQLALTRFLPGYAVVRVLANHVAEDPPYLVSEYVPGPSLLQRVRRSGPLQGSELDRLLIATLAALAAIHRGGVVHNDLKPANVVLGPRGPRIGDFDIAMRAGARDPDAAQDGVLGSAAFLAPERLDAGPAQPAGDVFAWAATMVFASTGRSPFHAPTKADVVRAVEHDPPDLNGVPEALRPLLARCLEKRPERRPSVNQALERLRSALAESATPAWGTPSAGPATTAPTNPADPTTSTPSAPSRSWASRLGAAVRVILPTLVVVWGMVHVATSGPTPGLPDATVIDYRPELAVTSSIVVRLADAGRTVHRLRQSGAGDTPWPDLPVPLAGVAAEQFLAARFAPDGAKIAVATQVPGRSAGAQRLHVGLWNAEDGRQIDDGVDTPPPIVDPADHVDLAVSTDAARLAWVLWHPVGSSQPDQVVVRDVTGRTTLADLRPTGLERGSLALSPDGRWLAYRYPAPDGGADRTRVVDLSLPGGRDTDLTTPCDGPSVFAGGTAGELPELLCRRQDGQIARLTLTGAPAGPPLDLACEAVPVLAVAPDGHRVACVRRAPGGGDGEELAVAALDGTAPQTFPLLPVAPLAVAWDGAGTEVAVGYLDSAVIESVAAPTAGPPT
jgi:serine/threonine protein kinase